MVAGRDLVRELKTAMAGDGAVPADKTVAARIGMTPVRFSQMKARDELSATQVAKLVLGADATSFDRGRSNLIRTVVEFFPIDRALNGRGGVHHELFDVEVDGVQHPYRAGLRGELQAGYGVYLFYDSRGRALYAGKAKRQSLWKEMKLAFNRDRGGLQKLSRVAHPTKRVDFRPSEEKRRQILEKNVPLSDLAHYFSAYEVASELIDSFEAFLIRAFPNDLLNKQKANLHPSKRPPEG